MQHLSRIVEIDLSTKHWFFRPFPKSISSQYLAGRGVNVAILNKELSIQTDPLGADNVLVMSCGLLTGKRSPVSPRLHINARSPLTNILGSSNIGGDFGIMLKSIDIQSLIIRGISESPLYLVVTNDVISFFGADNLWGKTTWETQEILQSKYPGRNVRILTIGPAGENLNRFASIIGDFDHAAGRTGMGTVMGSKLLKAIVVQGETTQAEKLENESLQTVKMYLGAIKSSPEYKYFSNYGGAGYVKWADDLGILATRNYRQNRFDKIDQIDCKKLAKYRVRKKGCAGCPIKCKADLLIQDLQNKKCARPEFETVVNLGSKCGQGDLFQLVNHDNLCTKLGLDTISTGNAISFAMDLYQRGLLTQSDTGGLDLSWGNTESMTELIYQMAYCTGLGKILSKGVRTAAQIIGKESEEFAPHVKGLELAAYHPYNIMGTALGYAISPRGGDFSSIYASLEYTWTPDKANLEFGSTQAVNLGSIYGKSSLIRRAMLVNVALDCLGICKVPALSLIGLFDLKMELELIEKIVGLKLSPKELFDIAERIVNTERLMNYRFGITGKDDRLPKMFFSRDYVSRGKPSEPLTWMEPMKQEFYREMGWDEDGRPTPRKLMELGIDPMEHSDYPAA